MKKLLTVLSLVSTSVFAQDGTEESPCQVFASPYQDCRRGTFHLNATPGFDLYSWSPPGGLNMPYLANPVTSLPGTYTVTASTFLGPNLVTNGDFSGGNTGFTSGHNYSSTYSPCNYYVAPTFFTFPGYADHTSTADNMFMSVDGCSQVLWQQTINISQNTNYSFAFWATRADAVVPQFEIRFNGVPVSTVPGYTFTGTWTWDQYNVQGWNSGANSTVTIQVINLEPSAYGVDFGMDDFIFHESCTSSYTVTANSSLLGPNMVNNWDFSAGNTGFTSLHTYTSWYNPCNYYVAPTFFTLQVPFPDHTPTSDNMFMSVDGCNTVVWEQTFSVTNFSVYNFEFWATKADLTQPTFEIHFIGNVTGDVIVGTQTGSPYPGYIDWERFRINCWNSTNNSTVTIRVINLQAAGNGNDFGMDDFSFRRCCNPDHCCNTIPIDRIAGTGDVKGSEMTVSPNPGQGTFTLNLSNAVKENTTVYVFDALGREVTQVKLSSGASTALFDIPVKGTYFVTMREGERTITTAVVVE